MTSSVPPTSLQPVRVGPYSDGELLQIARNQTVLIRTLIACLLIQMVAAAVPWPRGIFEFLLPAAWIVYPIAIISCLVAATFIYGLAAALRSPLTFVFVLLGLFPAVGLIVMFVLNGKATSALRDRGLRVGLLGANKHDVERLIVAMRESDPDYFAHHVSFDYRPRSMAAYSVQRTLVKVIIGLLLAWAAFHAVGAYFLNHNPARAAVVFGSMLLFLGFWLLVMRMSQARMDERDAADEEDEILLGDGEEENSTT